MKRNTPPREISSRRRSTDINISKTIRSLATPSGFFDRIILKSIKQTNHKEHKKYILVKNIYNINYIMMIYLNINFNLSHIIP